MPWGSCISSREPDRNYKIARSYEIARNTKLSLDVFNLFSAKTNDISYCYTSRLPG